jgi:hypothetical protein
MQSKFYLLGKEILAVTTFADEIKLLLNDNSSSYIQFWVIDSSLNAECLLLLEVPRCAVISMAWCPVLTNHPDKCFKSRSSRSQKTTNDCLGLLAVATDKGNVFIYRHTLCINHLSNIILVYPGNWLKCMILKVVHLSSEQPPLQLSSRKSTTNLLTLLQLVSSDGLHTTEVRDYLEFRMQVIKCVIVLIKKFMF